MGFASDDLPARSTCFCRVHSEAFELLIFDFLFFFLFFLLLPSPLLSSSFFLLPFILHLPFFSIFFTFIPFFFRSFLPSFFSFLSGTILSFLASLIANSCQLCSPSFFVLLFLRQSALFLWFFFFEILNGFQEAVFWSVNWDLSCLS